VQRARRAPGYELRVDPAETRSTRPTRSTERGADRPRTRASALPSGIPGYRPYCPHTLWARPAGKWTAPDFPRAQRLVAASGTRRTLITVWGWTDDPTIRPSVVNYIARVLRRLGYPTRVRLVPHDFFDHRRASVFRRIQLVPSAWGDTTYGFFATWFSCGSSFNHGWFCDARIIRKNNRARLVNATSPRAAASIWARIDRELVDEAAWLPLIEERGLDFVSARVRNYQFHPYWGVVADQLWLRKSGA
jgi:peptide/nickel transport system substrate-binding protein